MWPWRQRRIKMIPVTYHEVGPHGLLQFYDYENGHLHDATNIAERVFLVNYRHTFTWLQALCPGPRATLLRFIIRCRQDKDYTRLHVIVPGYSYLLRFHYTAADAEDMAYFVLED